MALARRASIEPMLPPDQIFRIEYRPPNAPNCISLFNAIGLGVDCADEDDTPGVVFGFTIYTEEVVATDTLPRRWVAACDIVNAFPPLGKGDTELAAVEDLRDNLVAVLRADLATFIEKWAEDRLLEEGEALDRASDQLGWVAELMRAQAKLRELDQAEEGSSEPDMYFQGTDIRCGNCHRKIANIDLDYHEHARDCEGESC